MKKELTFERANELLRYDPETGRIFWKVQRGKRGKVGKEAGYVNFVHGPDRTPYREITVDRKKYKAHRLAWLLHYGKWPAQQIDHIDGNGLNNRIENLRDVSVSVNQRNTKMPSDNKSGVTGVVRRKDRDRWQAQARINGKNKSLGLFEDISDAEAAVKNFRLLHGYTPRHGEKKQ